MSFRFTIISEQDCVELGLPCAGICRALDRGMNRKRLNNLSRPARRDKPVDVGRADNVQFG